MPVHLFGLPADMDRILAIARANNLVIIEDAAQAIGSRYGDRFTGTFGDYGCFSFFPSKNLGGAGDGGMITTNDPVIARTPSNAARPWQQDKIFPRDDRHQQPPARPASRGPARETAAPGRLAAGKAEPRRPLSPPLRILRAYLFPFIAAPPQPSPKFEHVYNQFTIRSSRRDELKPSSTPLESPPKFTIPSAFTCRKHSSFSATPPAIFRVRKASREVLSLPVYPELLDAQQGPRSPGNRQFPILPVGARFQPAFPRSGHLRVAPLAFSRETSPCRQALCRPHASRSREICFSLFIAKRKFFASLPSAQPIKTYAATSSRLFPPRHNTPH